MVDVPRDSRMVTCESFGPLAPIIRVKDLDDALELANSTDYGLSSGVVTTNLQSALKAIRTLRCGTVNINEVPGFRVESSPLRWDQGQWTWCEGGGYRSDQGLQLRQDVQSPVVAHLRISGS